MTQWFPRFNAAYFSLPRRAKWHVFRAWFTVSECILLIEIGLLLALVVGVAWAIVVLGLGSTVASREADHTFSLVVTIIVFVGLWIWGMTIYLSCELSAKIFVLKARQECLVCGYDLRGSPADECPECGEHIRAA